MATLENDKPSSEGNGYVQHRVYAYVVENICGRKFAPGSRISDRKIARTLGISHVPVREAFGKLEEQGWIERIPQKGARVRGLTLKDVEETVVLREVVESTAVRILSQSHVLEQLSELETLVAAIEAASDNGDRQAYEKADREFHSRLVQYTGSTRLSQLFEATMLQGTCSMPVLLGLAIAWNLHLHGSGYERTRVAGHRKILDAIREGEGDLAELLVRLHIRRFWQIVKEHGAAGSSPHLAVSSTTDRSSSARKADVDHPEGA